MNEISQAVPKRTQKQHLDILIALCREENDLKDSIKEAKKAAKDDGFDPAAMAAVAKAVAKATEAELVEKSNLIIETAEAYAG